MTQPNCLAVVAGSRMADMRAHATGMTTTQFNINAAPFRMHEHLESSPQSTASLVRQKPSIKDRTKGAAAPTSNRHHHDALSLDQAKEEARKDLVPALQRRSKIPRRQYTTLRAVIVQESMGPHTDRPCSKPRITSKVDASPPTTLNVSPGQNAIFLSDLAIPDVAFDGSQGEGTVSEPERDEDDVFSDSVLEKTNSTPRPCPTRFSPTRPVFLFRPIGLTPELTPPTPRPRHASSSAEGTSQSTVRRLVSTSPELALHFLPHNLPPAITLHEEESKESLWWWCILDPRIYVIVVAIAMGVFGWYCKAHLLELHDAMLPALDQFETSMNRVAPHAHTWHEKIAEVERQAQIFDEAFDADMRSLYRKTESMLDDQVLYFVALWDVQESIMCTNRSHQAVATMASSWSMKAYQVDVARLHKLQADLTALHIQLAELTSCSVLDEWIQSIARAEVDKSTDPSKHHVYPPRPADPLNDGTWFYLWCFAVVCVALACGVLPWLVASWWCQSFTSPHKSMMSLVTTVLALVPALCHSIYSGTTRLLTSPVAPKRLRPSSPTRRILEAFKFTDSDQDADLIFISPSH